MKIKMTESLRKYKEAQILKARDDDVKFRGPNCLVYNYFNQLTLLSDCGIWYNSKLEYVHPKEFVPHKSKKDDCILM
jgi:hypothetical protein